MRSHRSTRRISGTRAPHDSYFFLYVSLISLLGLAAVSLALSWVFGEAFVIALVLALAGYALSALFAVLSLTLAALRDGSAGRVAGKAFWAMVGCGVLLRFAGTLYSWALRSPGSGALLLLRDLAYTASYVAFFAALLWLVARTTSRITLLSALDASAVILSTGLLAWFFVVDPASEGFAGGLDRHLVLVALGRLVGDGALLFLSLVALSTTRRPRFAPLLAGAFASFLAADALHLGRRVAGSVAVGGWPELVWALGFLLLGLAALRAVSPAELAREVQISPWRVYAFWFGPLSPAVHLGVLLLFGAFVAPLPAYALLGGVVILAYMALRVGFVSRSSAGLREERERGAAHAEQARLSEELHDTLKQEVHSVPLMLELYRRAEADHDPEAAREILDRAIETSRGASYRISTPIRELGARSGTTLDALALIRQAMQDIDCSFPVEVREDLEAPLEDLDPEELAAAYRVVSEALWNAARHSGAKRVTVSSRRTEEAPVNLVIEVRDDGRGFSGRPGGEPEGLGLALMRERAENVGAELEIDSTGAAGTTVRLRFERRSP